MLEQLNGGRGAGGASSASHRAVIIPEPKNRYDRNAIAAYIRESESVMTKVGYFSRQNALAYAWLFRLIAPRGLICEAYLSGGWDRGSGDRGMFGVTLHLGSPAEIAVRVWSMDHPVSHAHRWAGMLVAFTGNETYALGPIPLDRHAREYLAKAAGCEVWPRVTKKLDLCVICDPFGGTAKAQRAAELGVPVMAEAQFWAELGF